MKNSNPKSSSPIMNGATHMRRMIQKLGMGHSSAQARFLALAFATAIFAAAFYSTSSASAIASLFGNDPLNSHFLIAAKPTPPVQVTVLGTTDLNVERRGHTATELADGNILIVGGENRKGPVGKSEIFDSLSRSFSLSANLKSARTDHAATRLADGRVLVTGGRSKKGSVSSTEIFDSATKSFTSGPAMKRARAGHTATALADGRILIAGGDAEGTAEIFDPADQSFTQLEANLTVSRSYHSAALLKNEKVLLVGGMASDGSRLGSAEIFDTTARRFSAAGNLMKGQRTRPSLQVLPDGKVQVIGGDTEGSMEMFNAEGGYFTAYVRILPDAYGVSEVLRTKTRAALIHKTETQDGKLPLVVSTEMVELLNRGDYSLTDAPALGLAVVAGGTNSDGSYLKSAAVLASSNATVTTDKTDYAPGETVIITGAGWLPGETVHLRIQRDNGAPDEILLSVADGDGNFQNVELIIQQSDLGVTFLLTATGLSSGYTAQTTFTDGNVKVFPGPGEPKGAVSFTLTKTIYASTDCSTGAGTPTVVNDVETPSGNTTGVGNTDSIVLTAAAFSDQGGAFINWTSDHPFTVVDAFSICVAGEFTGNRDFIANYELPPCVITCPDDIEVSNDPGQCGAVVNYSAPTDNGACGTVECSPASGETFPVGTTTVTCMETTPPGFASPRTVSEQCTFDVTVNDTESPSIGDCPDDITQPADPGECSAVVTYTTPTASDNCTGTPTVVCMPASGSTFSVGTTTVTCTATDDAGNTAQCTFDVTVNDGESPDITCPTDITQSNDSEACSAVVTYTTPTASDNCTESPTVVCTPASGETFPVGETTVTCTATDAAGNEDSCSFKVTVEDDEDPVVTCPDPITAGNGPAVVNFAATANDNCDGSITPVCTPPSGSVFPIGETTVNCTATDTAGNEDSCSFKVTVEEGAVEDNEAPEISCSANIVAIAANPGDSCVPVNFTVTATDNLPGVTVECVESNGGQVVTSGFCFPTNTTCTTVTCTATDAAGNMDTCSFTVSTYDVFLQDDSRRTTRELVWNSFTGDYIFCCDGVTVCGTGQASRRDSLFSLMHFTSTYRLKGDLGLYRGNASLKIAGNTCTIQDRDIRDNILDCVSTAPCAGCAQVDQ